MNSNRQVRKGFKEGLAGLIHLVRLSGATLVKDRLISRQEGTNNSNRQAMKTYSKSSSHSSQWETRDSREQLGALNKHRLQGGRKGRTYLWVLK
jgi:hypothetical protein